MLCNLVISNLFLLPLFLFSITEDVVSFAKTFCGSEKNSTKKIELTLPPAIFVVHGIETDIFFQDIVLAENIQNYSFLVDCPIGAMAENKWKIVPAASDTGSYRFAISVFDKNNKFLDSSSCALHIVERFTGFKDTLKLLIVGNSLTEAGWYPQAITDSLIERDKAIIKCLGTGTKGTAGFVGHGGRTWNWFFADTSSPFVSLDGGGKSNFSLSRYLKEKYNGMTPAIITFELGINDCIWINSDSVPIIDYSIDTMFLYSDLLIKKVQMEIPNAKIGICLTTAPNVRETAYKLNFGDQYTYWRWKRIQHRLVQKYISHYKSYNNVYLIPTELTIDPLNGYPENDAVHPNILGYRQMANTIYGWIKWVVNEPIKPITSVKRLSTQISEGCSLRNFPNPFNQSTTIVYILKNSTSVTLSIYNLLGEKISTLINEEQKPGEKKIIWNGQNSKGENVASGIYFYIIKIEDNYIAKKMLLLK